MTSSSVFASEVTVPLVGTVIQNASILLMKNGGTYHEQDMFNMQQLHLHLQLHLMELTLPALKKQRGSNTIGVAKKPWLVIY